MNVDDNNVIDHEHKFNNVSCLISILLTHICLLIYTKGPKIFVLSRILRTSHEQGRGASRPSPSRRPSKNLNPSRLHRPSAQAFLAPPLSVKLVANHLFFASLVISLFMFSV